MEELLKQLEQSPVLKELLMKVLQTPKQNVFLDGLKAFMEQTPNPSTRQAYRSTLRKLEKYFPDIETLTYEQMTPAWLKAFDRMMELEGLKTNGRSVHMRNIRAVFNYAITEELTSCYPFRKFKIRKEETAKRSLTLEQLVRFLSCRVRPVYKEYLLVFRLMLYLRGINLTDLMELKPENIVDGRLVYIRRKTHKRYSVKLEPEAMKIIHRLRGKNWLLRMHDRYDNPHDYCKHINDALKTFIREEPFSSISTYWARHTVATLMVNELDVTGAILERVSHAGYYTKPIQI